MRDQEKENSKKPKKKKEKQKNAVAAKAPAKSDVPRLTVSGIHFDIINLRPSFMLLWFCYVIPGRLGVAKS